MKPGYVELQGSCDQIPIKYQRPPNGSLAIFGDSFLSTDSEVLDLLGLSNIYLNSGIPEQFQKKLFYQNGFCFESWGFEVSAKRIKEISNYEMMEMLPCEDVRFFDPDFFEQEGGGFGIIIVENHSENDLVMVIVSPAIEYPLSLFIRSERRAVLPVLDGTYQIYISMGKDWNDNEHYFEQSIGYFSWKEPISLQSTKTTYGKFTLYFSTVNIDQEAFQNFDQISPDEFPDPVR
jgi:hypothetical protein